MSLRYKALVAVLALVAMVTGGLGFYVSNLYRDSERARIRRDLKRDADQLNAELDTFARVTAATLKNSARSSEVVRLLADTSIDLKQNFDPLVAAWRVPAKADVALTTVNSFIAEDRKAKVIHKYGDLSVIAFDAPGKAFDGRRETLMADAALGAFLKRCYAHAEEKPNEEESRSSVIAIADSCFLAVASPLFESLQNHEVAGVGCVLIELSSSWAVQNHMGEGKLEAEDNAVRQLIYIADRLTAETLGSKDAAAKALDAALKSSGEFEVMLEVHGHPSAYVGRLNPFVLAEDGPGGKPAFIALKNLDRELEPLAALQRNVGLGGLALGVLGAAVAYAGAYMVIRKLRRLQDATLKVRQGNFNTRIRFKGRDELGSLATAFNDMTTGLKALGVYTDDALAKKLIDGPDQLASAGRREEGSILFCDIKGFTPIAEKLGAEDLVNQLNEHFTVMGKHIKDSKGYLDKFIGDAVMAYWGPPFFPDKDFAKRACKAALLSLRAEAELRRKWREQGKPEFFLRIGIGTGDIVIGNLGSDTKKNFTVIGDSVNLASRLEGANKFYGTETLVDERTAELAGSEFLLREVDQIRVTGKQVAVRVYEMMGVAAETSSSALPRCIGYGKALKLYRNREFAAAAEQLKALLAREPADGPAKWLLGVCEKFMVHPPDADWDGVTIATEK
ncbi:MAG: adenylate/guanylate cyclase domain-containing protein [Planctomycetes bacterium]|nr:adenylate/guanylate cyclase domain-containing protein [Planctomycetota bacterium]